MGRCEGEGTVTWTGWGFNQNRSKGCDAFSLFNVSFPPSVLFNVSGKQRKTHNTKSAEELYSASYHSDLNVPVWSHVITVSLSVPIFDCLPRWGTADAEIKVR